MSARNLFVIYPTYLKVCGELKEELIKISVARDIGINFNVKGYQDEILEKLKIKEFFCISDSFDSIETDSLFSTNDSFEAIRNLYLSPNELLQRELEYLEKKYSFLNNIIEKIFNYLPDVSSVHYYVSNQYCIELSDYYNVIVKDNDLTKALVESFRPTKNENYFGLKTIKFVIMNNKM